MNRRAFDALRCACGTSGVRGWCVMAWEPPGAEPAHGKGAVPPPLLLRADEVIE